MEHAGDRGGREAEDAEDVARLRRAAEADRHAFDLLVARHQAAVFRLARALTGSDAAAEDVLQETFLAAWRAAGAYRGEGSVRAWLLTIAHHKAGRFLRRRAGEPTEHLPLDALALAAGYGAEVVEGRVEARERRAALEAALGRLGAEERAILVLRDLEGLTGPEAADVLGLTLAGAKTRLHRARLRLMAALRQGDDHEG